MSKPTEQQIKLFEAAHKEQFANLVIANNLFLNVMLPYIAKLKAQKNYNTDKAAQKKVADVMAYGKKIAGLAAKWLARQMVLETKAGVPKVAKDTGQLFFKKDQQKKLVDMAKAYISPKDTATVKKLGIGFIPLIVWGVLAIVAAFTAYQIIDETTTTAQEKAELLKATDETLKNLNIPPDKAAAIIQSTQQQATETGGGIMQNITGGGSTLLPLAGIALVAYFLMKND